MFSGIVQKVGVLKSRSRVVSGARLVVSGELPGEPVAAGESVAVNGACLTVEAVEGGQLAFFCSQETLDRTNLGRLPLGSRVNLERALRVGESLGGHFVSGHVDACVRVLSLRREGEGRVLRVPLPKALAGEVVEKGSVALDGVSLTVSKLGLGWFEVVLVPFTLGATTLGELRVGREVNLETDILGKYVRRFLSLGPEKAAVLRLHEED
ncbi:MAG: riboflavin synthase [Thermoanaerobaculaceae bacterium]